MKPLDVLARFAATGSLGPLRCRASLPELIEVLGPPWDGGRIHHETRWPHRFGYESVELVACRCRLVWSVHFDTWHTDHVVPGNSPGEWLPGVCGITQARLTAALDQAGCSWRATAYPDIHQVTVSAAPPGAAVEFVFITREDHESPSLPEPTLFCAGATAPQHTCPPLPPDEPDDGLGR